MQEKKYYIVDFDSTFTQVEALDELARLSLEKHPARELIYAEIERLTNLAMEGKISFRESLTGRVKLLQANQSHLDKLVQILRKKVSASFSRNRDFLLEHQDDVLIVSGGFKEFIVPVVSRYGIKPAHVYANTFLFDADNNITGYDAGNPLSEEGGKVKLLRELKLQGTIYGIGDGYSDFQLKESGMIEKFYAFTENIERQSVLEKADHVTPSLDEFLFLHRLPRAISYPRNRIICMLMGDVPEISLHLLKREGFTVRHEEQIAPENKAEIAMILATEGTHIDDVLLKEATKLKTIGYLGKSKDYINRAVCSQLGIVLFDDKKNKKRNTEFIPRYMVDFINKGDTTMSRNFPTMQLPRFHQAHRLIHIHRNQPGIMAEINNLYARHNINIVAQLLMTRGEIGYVITDISKGYDERLLKELKAVSSTIKLRVIY